MRLAAAGAVAATFALSLLGIFATGAGASIVGDRTTACPAPAGGCQAGYEVVNSGANFKAVTASTYLRRATDDNNVSLGVHLQRYHGGPEAAIGITANPGLTDYDVFWTQLGGSPSLMSHSAFTIHRGDTVTYAVSYNSAAGTIVFTLRDVTQAIQTNRTEHGVASGLVFRLAGAGAEDRNAASPQPGGKLAAFTNVGLTTANGKVNGFNSWFTTQPVEGVIGTTPVLVPSISGAGTSFSVGVNGLAHT
jgi:hypothetical protein